MTDTPALPAAAPESCPHCGKPAALCVCDFVEPVETRVRLAILQHPQEQDVTLGSARLAVRHFVGGIFKVGLSWPSLSKAVGREVDVKRWAVMHLGSVDTDAFPPGRDLAVVDKDGKPVADQAAALKGIEGVVAFDGSWSQAKTLWWRNPWVLKARRLVIRPAQPSLYGKLRKEPRREGLSTLEAVAFVISRLEGKPEIEKAMLSSFRRMLQRYRDSLPPPQEKSRKRRPGSPASAPSAAPASGPGSSGGGANT
ncbi:tRNA-uridine aminocarboxypropyltransferase [Prosthecomicrobium hirschii]|uniref:tRNA-uridine aminocarboxypropyltransferase n=1 Tax=Prosthecodimorpha hirschii TaxID=665126 RepID=UPI0009FA4FD7|nr:tRNA-uridine aminocarboxypropyltransferase [Prosthecomicrobium hirschii]